MRGVWCQILATDNADCSIYDRKRQNSEPYILDVQAGRTLPDARTKGYTLAVKTTFRNLDDMEFYDSDCETHKRLKSVAAPLREGDVFVAYFEDEVALASSV